MSPRRIFIVLMLTLSLVGIGLSTLTKRHHPSTDSDCFSTSLRCNIMHDSYQMQVSLSRPPEIEEQISLEIDLGEAPALESAWIEGVNMYMGKIHVPLERLDNGKYAGWFMLGSCSEPNMEWQLYLKVTGDMSPATLRFKTSQH